MMNVMQSSAGQFSVEKKSRSLEPFVLVGIASGETKRRTSSVLGCTVPVSIQVLT